VEDGTWIDPPPRIAGDKVDPRDLFGPPIPPGEYVACFVDQERRAKMFRNGSEKWLVRMRLAEGEHAGRELLFAVPVLPRKSRPHPGSKMAALFCAVMGPGIRPWKDLPKRSPKNLLANCNLLVEVATVDSDPSGVLRPAGLHYSVVRRVVARLEGTPPCLRAQ
jgi:hypothetical protein